MNETASPTSRRSSSLRRRRRAARRAGSGTTGEAAAKHGRGFVLIDEEPMAARIAARRLAAYAPELVGLG